MNLRWAIRTAEKILVRVPLAGDHVPVRVSKREATWSLSRWLTVEADAQGAFVDFRGATIAIMRHGSLIVGFEH